MTGTKRSTLLQSNLWSPASNKLTSQYIVKNNLTHHYKLLQNVSSCIDNSTPESLLKSQKIRDRNKQKKKPTSRPSTTSSVYTPTKSRPTSQIQDVYYGDYSYLQQDWKEAFKNDEDDDDDELYQIVEATLGKKPDQISMTDYPSDDSCYGFSQSARLSNYYDKNSSNVPSSSCQSRAFSSTSRSTKASKKSNIFPMKDQPGDVLQSRTHVFTQPEKEFTPRILKTSKQSLLSQCKYYNPPKHRKEKAKPGSNNSKKETSNVSENYPEPESMTEMSYNSSQLSKTSSTLVEEPVPKLDLSSGKEERRAKVKPKKATQSEFNVKKKTSVTPDVGISKENNMSEEENIDIKKNMLRKYRSSLNSTDSTFKQPSMQHFSSKSLSDIYQSNETNSHLENQKVYNEINQSECEYINFMKHVTEDILLKGLFTNRAIQQVFEFHIMKYRGKLDEEKMRRMLMNFLKDVGIKPESDASFNGNTSKSNKLNSNFPSYSEYMLPENLSRRTSLASNLEKSYEKNMEKLTDSVSGLNVRQTERKLLVKESPQPEVSSARKQRHQSSRSSQRNGTNVAVTSNQLKNDAEEKKVISDEKTDISNEKMDISNEKKVISNEKKVISDEKKVISDEKKVISDEKKVISDEKKVISDEKKVISDEKKVISDEKKVISDEKKVISDEKKVISDEKLITGSPDASMMNCREDIDSRQNNKPIPRPRRKNSLSNVSQESSTVKDMTFITQNSDLDIFCEKAAGDGIISKEPFLEGTASVNSSLKIADNVSEIKVASEPVKSESNLSMSIASNIMNLSSEESPSKSPELDRDSVGLESAANFELTNDSSQVNQSPDSPINSLSDNHIEEQNDYEEDKFESDDSDSDF